MKVSTVLNDPTMRRYYIKTRSGMKLSFVIMMMMMIMMIWIQRNPTAIIGIEYIYIYVHSALDYLK